MPAFFSGESNRGAYATVRDSEFYSETRDFIEQCWRRYEPFCADRHFLADAQDHFFERTWELYLASTFLEGGTTLSTPTSEGPDFRLLLRGLTWVEATVAHHGEGADAVLDREDRAAGPDFPGIFRLPSEESLILRCTSALRSKAERIASYRSCGIVGEQDACVVAISLGVIEDAALRLYGPAAPFLAKAFLGVGADVVRVTIGDDASAVTNLPRPNVAKASGASVSAQQLFDEAYSCISGVLVSARTVLYLPDASGGDLQFLHNPKAAVPLPRGVFPFGKELVLVNDELHVFEHVSRPTQH